MRDLHSKIFRRPHCTSASASLQRQSDPQLLKLMFWVSLRLFVVGRSFSSRIRMTVKCRLWEAVLDFLAEGASRLAFCTGTSWRSCGRSNQSTLYQDGWQGTAWPSTIGKQLSWFCEGSYLRCQPFTMIVAIREEFADCNPSF